MKKCLISIFLFLPIIAISQINWQRVESNIGDYSILFPGTATPLPNPQTGTEVFTAIFENSIFMFTVENTTGRIINDKEDIDIHNENYKRSVYDGLNSELGGRLISDKNITYKGIDAVDFYVSINQYGSPLKYGRGRLLVDDNYVILGFYAYSVFNEHIYDKYVNSIEISLMAQSFNAYEESVGSRKPNSEYKAGDSYSKCDKLIIISPSKITVKNRITNNITTYNVYKKESNALPGYEESYALRCKDKNGEECALLYSRDKDMEAIAIIDQNKMVSYKVNPID